MHGIIQLSRDALEGHVLRTELHKMNNGGKWEGVLDAIQEQIDNTQEAGE